ncbi:MAG: hypothetical protein HFG51_08805 [Lachnospiraceae bacterium]|nr:hypothetical protein [Lachnospiraceae bacterium]
MNTQTAEPEFYVRFLGGFSLSFAGKEVAIKANPLGKSMQMLFFLLKAGESGCEKKELLELVRPGEKNRQRRLNNFRQQIYMVRKLIRDAHFPEGDYIISRGTRYYFTLDYPVKTDTERLDCLIGQIRGKSGDEQEMEAQCQTYCEAYTGEFLPLLGGEEWVALESAHYQKWYFTCLNKLSVRLKEEKKFERLLHLAKAASQLHPYDEWQIVQIDCLMALNRRREAERVYEEASALFYQDLGLTSLDRAMAKYQERSRTYPLSRAMERMKEELEEEKKGEGAYYCSYPSFVDIYRIRARLDEMNQEKSLLLLCTLSGGKEGWREAERIRQMELFRKTLTSRTRSEDVYTQYSSNQYLALISGAGQGAEKLMITRLKSGWKKAGGQAEVEYSIGEVEGTGNRFFDRSLLASEAICGMEEKMNRKETFVVHIISQENATWQGQVTWMGREETLSFRSFLELVKLMDHAIAEDEAAG